mgnify:CR=1 FL=1
MRRATRGIVLVGLWWGGVAGASETIALPVLVRVEVTEGERVDPPVVWALPEGVDGQALEVVDTTMDAARRVPCQVDPLTRTVWWHASGTLPAGSVRTYRVQSRLGTGATPVAVEAAIVPTGVEFRWQGRLLARYRQAHVEPPPGMNPRYGRSAHLHPIATLHGAVVSDEMPPDHAHQSGIFLAYPRTQFAGQAVDFWNLAAGQGRVRFAKRKHAASGPLFAQFVVEHEHVALDPASDPQNLGAETGGTTVLLEEWLVRAGQIDPQGGLWCLDIVSTLRCASDQPLHLPQYHYGGMAVRGARSWTPGQVQCVTSEGQSRLEGNHTRPRWCQMRGPVDGHAAGIVLMTHPDNFRFPEPLRIHPTMPYMVYTPSFLGDWEIVPGRPHVSRFRFIIHDGELPPERIERSWRDFAHPLVAQTVGRAAP